MAEFVAWRCTGAGVDREKGKRAGFVGTPLSGKRLKLPERTKEDRKWLLKGPGKDNHLNEGMGTGMGESAGGGARLQGGKNG